jgi:hypothetical protein
MAERKAVLTVHRSVAMLAAWMEALSVAMTAAEKADQLELKLGRSQAVMLVAWKAAMLVGMLADESVVQSASMMESPLAD